MAAQWRSICRRLQRRLFDGEGILTDATGESYRGRFAVGLKDGAAIVTPLNAPAYQVTYRAGVEVPGSRLSLDGVPILVQDGSANAPIRIGIAVDQSTGEGLQYTAIMEQGVLSVFPSDERLMSVWRGGGEIQLEDDEMFSPRGFLGPPDRYGPIMLRFQIENLSRDPVHIIGSYLDVVFQLDGPGSSYPNGRTALGVWRGLHAHL